MAIRPEELGGYRPPTLTQLLGLPFSFKGASIVGGKTSAGSGPDVACPRPVGVGEGVSQEFDP